MINASGPAVFGWISALDVVPRLRVPTLYVVGAADVGGGFAADAQKLFDATAASDKAIHVLDTYRHGVDLVTLDPRARALVEGFLRSH